MYLRGVPKGGKTVRLGGRLTLNVPQNAVYFVDNERYTVRQYNSPIEGYKDGEFFIPDNQFDNSEPLWDISLINCVAAYTVNDKNGIESISSTIDEMLDTAADNTCATLSGMLGEYVVVKYPGKGNNGLRLIKPKTEGGIASFLPTHIMFAVYDDLGLDIYSCTAVYINESDLENAIVPVIQSAAKIEEDGEGDGMLAFTELRPFGSYTGSNNKIDAVKVLQLFEQDLLFFNETDVMWDGSQHILKGIQLNQERIDDFPEIIDNLTDFTNGVADLLNYAESAVPVIPRDKIGEGLRSAMGEGDMTGIAFFSLAAHNMTKTVIQEQDRLFVAVDVEAKKLIPDGDDYLNQVYTALFRYNDITEHYVEITNFRNLDGTGPVEYLDDDDDDFGFGDMDLGNFTITAKVGGEEIYSSKINIADAEGEKAAHDFLSAFLDNPDEDKLKKFIDKNVQLSGDSFMLSSDELILFRDEFAPTNAAWRKQAEAMGIDPTAKKKPEPKKPEPKKTEPKKEPKKPEPPKAAASADTPTVRDVAPYGTLLAARGVRAGGRREPILDDMTAELPDGFLYLRQEQETVVLKGRLLPHQYKDGAFKIGDEFMSRAKFALHSLTPSISIPDKSRKTGWNDTGDTYTHSFSIAAKYAPAGSVTDNGNLKEVVANELKTVKEANPNTDTHTGKINYIVDTPTRVIGVYEMREHDKPSGEINGRIYVGLKSGRGGAYYSGIIYAMNQSVFDNELVPVLKSLHGHDAGAMPPTILRPLTEEEKAAAKAEEERQKERKRRELEAQKMQREAERKLKEEERKAAEAKRREEEYQAKKRAAEAAEALRKSNYDKAVTQAERAQSSAQLKRAAEAFLALGDYNDAKTQAKNLAARADEKKALEQKKMKQGGIIAAAALALVVALTLFNTQYLKPNKAYKAADALFQNGEYDKAIVAFRVLDGFKDSDERINEIKYIQAGEMAAAGDVYSALRIYEELGDYKDALAILAEFSNSLNNAIISQVSDCLKEGDVAMAEKLFGEWLKSATDTENKTEMISRIVDNTNDFGDEILAKNNFTDAITAYESAYIFKTNTADAPSSLPVGMGGVHTEKSRNALYLQAEHQLELGDYARSSIGFAALDGYKDSSSKLKEASALWRESAAATLAVGEYQAIALTNEGKIIVTPYEAYKLDTPPEWQNVISVSYFWLHTVGLKSDGTAVAAGNGAQGQCAVSSWSDLVSVSAGLGHTVGLKADGTVVAVGDNSYGQCEVAHWDNIIAVCAGNAATFGLKADGTIVEVGQKDSRHDVSDWRNVTAVSHGMGHFAALMVDRTVMSTDGEGQIKTEGWDGIVSIASGFSHLVGLKSDGTVVAAGYNGSGECNVSEWSDIVAIAAGNECTLGLKSDGTVVYTGRASDIADNIAAFANIKLPAQK